MYPREKIKEGTWFIDLEKDYDEIKLITTGNNPKNDNKLSVIWHNFPDEPTIIKLKDFSGTPFPDLNGPWTQLFDILELYHKQYSISREEAEALLKLSVGKGLLRYEKQKGAVQFRLLLEEPI